MRASLPTTALPPRLIDLSGKTQFKPLLDHAGEGDIADGFVIAVEKCGLVLAEHFPPEPGQEDQLPDRIFLI